MQSCQATVIPITLIRMPGTFCKASMQAPNVEPVVMTSSSSRTCLPDSTSASCTRKICATFCCRSDSDLRVWLSLFRSRTREVVSIGRPVTDCTPRAIHSDWLYPLFRSRFGCSGTGSRQSTASNNPDSRYSSAAIRPKWYPNCLFPSYFWVQTD